jgi:hypothetical protein
MVMLQRAKPSQPSRGVLRNRKYRRRAKAGRRTAPVEYDQSVVNFLVRWKWLTPRDDDISPYTSAEIGAAISAMLADSARR